MIRYVVNLWILLSASGTAVAALFGLVWDPPQEASGMHLEYVIAGDRDPVVITNNPRNAHTLIFCGTNTNLFFNQPLQPGTWYYVAYSISSNAWSDPSNMVEVRIPGPPTNVVRVAIDVSPDLNLWTNAGFIRLRIE